MKDEYNEITISWCPMHGVYAISIDAEYFGTRLTPDKCCGQWETIKSWPLKRFIKELNMNLNMEGEK